MRLTKPSEQWVSSGFLSSGLGLPSPRASQRFSPRPSVELGDLRSHLTNMSNEIPVRWYSSTCLTSKPPIWTVRNGAKGNFKKTISEQRHSVLQVAAVCSYIVMLLVDLTKPFYTCTRPAFKMTEKSAFCRCSEDLVSVACTWILLRITIKLNLIFFVERVV